MHYTALPDRALLAVAGEETVSFLQGLVSNDVAKLKEGAMMYAALLSPQGKFLHDFFMVRRGEAILLDIDTSRLSDLLQRLILYKLRSKIHFTKLENEIVAAAWQEEFPSRQREESGEGGNNEASPPYIPPASGGDNIFSDPRLPELGYRMIGGAEPIKTITQHWQQATPEAYDRMRLALGVPGTQDFVPDRSLLLEFGFEELHGVDFNKGCYVGQEVTARSKHRAQLRKGLYQVKGMAELPPAGTQVMAGGIEVGQLRTHQGESGLAVLKSEDVEKAAAAGTPLTAANVTIASAVVPRWIASRSD